MYALMHEMHSQILVKQLKIHKYNVDFIFFQFIGFKKIAENEPHISSSGNM